MTPDEILRAAHRDGTWDEVWKLTIPDHASATAIADFTDKQILERSKRRDALGVEDVSPERARLLHETEYQRAEAYKFWNKRQDAEPADLRARNAEREARIDKLHTDVAVRDDHIDALKAELTSLRERKPNYEAVYNALYRKWDEIPPEVRVQREAYARKIADAAFEPMS